LTIREKGLGPEHPDVASGLNNLAELYRMQGHHAKAEPLLQRALSIKKKVLGEDHPDVALALGNLAMMRRGQGKLTEAEGLYQQSLKMRERSLGTDHPDVAITLHNLASLYHGQGRSADAEPLVDRAIAIRERSHVAPADRFLSYHLRAQIAWALGRKSEGVADLKRALDLAEQQRGQIAGAEH